jgi:hypothetical protein
MEAPAWPRELPETCWAKALLVRWEFIVWAFWFKFATGIKEDIATF